MARQLPEVPEPSQREVVTTQNGHPVPPTFIAYHFVEADKVPHILWHQFCSGDFVQFISLGPLCVLMKEMEDSAKPLGQVNFQDGTSSSYPFLPVGIVDQ